MQMFPHVNEFSAGYYLLDGLFVEPTDEVDVPQVQEHVYAHLQNEYYEARRTPMLLRHNTAEYHFRIRPDEGTPFDTIRMPFEMVDDLDLDVVPDEEQFLLAKPRHAHNLYQLSTVSKAVIEE